MRTCIYASGQTVLLDGTATCPDPGVDADGFDDPLVDWSDSIDVTTPAPTGPMMLLGLGVLFFLARKR